MSSLEERILKDQRGEMVKTPFDEILTPEDRALAEEALSMDISDNDLFE